MTELADYRIAMPDKAEIPLTSGDLIKWGSILIAAMGGLISVVMAYSGVKTTLAEHDVRILNNAQAIVQVDLNSANRHTQAEKDIDRVTSRTDGLDHSVTEISHKLDAAVAILERLDKKTDWGK